MFEQRNEKLFLTEYEEVLLDNISKVVVPRSYIETNPDFWNFIVFKFWEVYYKGLEDISIRKQAEILEIMLSGLFKYQPSLEKTEDIVRED